MSMRVGAQGWVHEHEGGCMWGGAGVHHNMKFIYQLFCEIAKSRG